MRRHSMMLVPMPAISMTGSARLNGNPLRIARPVNVLPGWRHSGQPLLRMPGGEGLEHTQRSILEGEGARRQVGDPGAVFLLADELDGPLPVGAQAFAS